ncbi:MAG: transglycosylase SLT domain-containing protein [Archangium sp.]
MTNGIRTNGPLPTLPHTRNAAIGVETLAPWIHKFAAQYRTNPQIVAAIVAQESSFVNHRVHRDGTGHGLVGLDDNGLLPEFEKWAGVKVGRGQNASTIAPSKQIEFLAKKLSELTKKFHGKEWEAVRAWHGGVKGRNRSHAKEYETIIRGRISEIDHVVRPVTAGAAPPESNFVAHAIAPVTLTPKEQGEPVRGSLDFENT